MARQKVQTHYANGELVKQFGEKFTLLKWADQQKVEPNLETT
jgi:hypothetical protein